MDVVRSSAAPLDPDQLARLRARCEAEGIGAVAKALGIPRCTVERAAAGGTLRRGTRMLFVLGGAAA